jgi:hypothetical protein
VPHSQAGYFCGVSNEGKAVGANDCQIRYTQASQKEKQESDDQKEKQESDDGLAFHRRHPDLLAGRPMRDPDERMEIGVSLLFAAKASKSKLTPISLTPISHRFTL